MKRLLGGLLGAALLVCASARAQPRDTELEPNASPVTAALVWDARDPRCPTEQALARATEARLGRSVFTTHDADVVIRGAATVDAHGVWHAELELVRRDGRVVGTRVLATTSTDCSALAEALPLVVALMVDLPREHVSLRLPEPARVTPSSRSAPEPWGFALSVGPTLTVGLLPGVHWGARTGVELRAPRLVAVRVSASLWAPSESRSALGASRSWAVLGGAAACARARAGSAIEVQGCAGADLGRFEAEGRYFDENASDSGLLASVVAAAIGSLRLGGPWWLTAELRLQVPLVRRVFTVRSPAGDQAFFETSAVAGEVALALGMRFGR